MSAYFVTGTDTGIGKTVAVALLANYFESKGYNTITQKWIQTGCTGFSEDLEYHIEFMKKKYDKENKVIDKMCPYIFSLPASPHLAAKVEKVKINKNKIIETYKYMNKNFDKVIIEGAGGVLVPYNQKNFLIDIVKELDIPIIIVSENRLGTINQTLLTIEAIKSRGLKILGVIFNNLSNSKEKDKVILKDNISIIEKLGKTRILGEIKYSNSKNALIKNFENIGKKLI